MATAAPEVRLSRVGKRPVVIPKGVTVNLSEVKLDVQGPKGKMSVPIPGQVVAKKDGDAISFTSSAPGRDGARLQGLARALFASAVKGSAEGYEKVLELVGTGYRAEVKGKVITLALGFSHPTNVEVPASITAVVPGLEGHAARAHLGGQGAARSARGLDSRPSSTRALRWQRHSLPRREHPPQGRQSRQGQG
jgi:large subunit ribosomal protein L6